MLQMIFDVAIALVMYFLPGYILLSWIDFPSLRGLNRYLLALCVSLVITPFSFIVVGNIVHLQPGLWAWLILVILLGLGSWILKRTNRRVKINLINATTDTLPDITNVSRLEKWGVVIFLILFAAVANLPRLLMFFQGGNVMELGPYDENWHIQQLVAVARTGIPPANYFFPSIHLGYYYGSWVYPATLGNLPFLSVSLMRAMSIHAYIQIFGFLGLIYVLLQVNIRRPWVRLIGICFFTVMGGLDLFAKMPGIDNIEFWIRDPGWLLNGVKTMQISQFFTLYLWVPHHLAGGMVTVLLLLLYMNLDMPRWLKLACTGVLFGFCITTSPFVFFGLVIAAGIVILWNIRSLWRERTSMLFPIILAIGLFLLVAWSPIWTYSLHNSSLTFNDFRIALVERFRGNTEINAIIDKSLTMFGLPLVAGTLMIVNMGLVFILYIVWWIKHLFSHDPSFHTTQDILLGFQPLVSIIFIFMVTDVGGGSNVAMRSMIPAQILITLAAILVIDWLADLIQANTVKRVIFIYLFTCFLLAQSVSPLAELRSNTKRVIEIAAWKECGVLANIKGTFDPDYCLPTDAYRYIYWLNKNTSPDALVLENGPYCEDSEKFRWLERERLLAPADSSCQSLHFYDTDFILPSEWNRMTAQGTDTMNALQWYQMLDFPGKGQHPVYLVTRQAGQAPPGAGDPVYQDDTVKIYALSQAVLKP
jgi:hypothetical protein